MIKVKFHKLRIKLIQGETYREKIKTKKAQMILDEIDEEMKAFNLDCKFYCWY